MLFTDFTYSPQPAVPDVRLSCRIGLLSLVKPIEVAYQIHPQHRNRNRNKSQWVITYEEELAVFAESAFNGIVEDGQYMWGLYRPGVKPEVLGETKKGDPTKIAVFDNGRRNGFWHGYPADYIREQEIPPDNVIDLWRSAHFITKSDINRIVRGQW